MILEAIRKVFPRDPFGQMLEVEDEARARGWRLAGYGRWNKGPSGPVYFNRGRGDAHYEWEFEWWEDGTLDLYNFRQQRYDYQRNRFSHIEAKAALSRVASECDDPSKSHFNGGLAHLGIPSWSGRYLDKAEFATKVDAVRHSSYVLLDRTPHQLRTSEFAIAGPIAVYG